MGFVPVKSLTTYVKSDEQVLQIDFVTCMNRGEAALKERYPELDTSALRLVI